jgi:Tol biopolymer transport system component
MDGQPTWSGDGSALYFISDNDSRISDIWSAPTAGGEPVRVTKQGVLSNPVTRRGRPELFASIVNAAGKFDIVQVMPDGSVRTVWNRTNAFPVDLTPTGDSLFIAESPVGGGGFNYRLVPATGGAEAHAICRAAGGVGGSDGDYN